MATYGETLAQVAKNVAERKKQEYKRKLDLIDEELSSIVNEKWCDAKKFLLDEKKQFPGITDKTGTYMIIHSTDDFKTHELFYIGQGVVADRKSNHKSIFLNEGNPATYYNDPSDPSRITSQVDSVIARKMYAKDPNREHWYLTYRPSPKEWATELEAGLISILHPIGNDEKMSGKS